MSNLFFNFFPPQLENGETPVYSSGMFNERETAVNVRRDTKKLKE